MPAYDADAVAALADQQVSWRDKALPPGFWGRTVAEVLADRPRLSQLPTPLMTLSASGLRHNVDTLATWCTRHGVELADLDGDQSELRQRPERLGQPDRRHLDGQPRHDERRQQLHRDAYPSRHPAIGARKTIGSCPLRGPRFGAGFFCR